MTNNEMKDAIILMLDDMGERELDLAYRFIRAMKGANQ